MSLDLFMVGPPASGLFLFGRRLSPPKDESAGTGGENGEKATPSASPRSPGREMPLNPHAEALRTLERIEHQRQVLGMFQTSSVRKSLGAQIDLRA